MQKFTFDITSLLHKVQSCELQLYCNKLECFQYQNKIQKFLIDETLAYNTKAVNYYFYAIS